MSRSAATCGCPRSSSTAACAFPTAWSSARTRSSTPSASAAPKSGVCLITQPMIDKLDAMSRLKVLSVASEIFPLVKTGGLADVVGALPGALAREDVEVDARWCPAIPAVLAKLDARRAASHRYRRSVRRPGARARRPRPAGSTSSCSTRRISSTGPATPTSARTASTGPTTRCASRRWRGSARTSARARSTSFVPDVVHAHDWQAGAGAGLSALRRRPRPGDGHHRSTTSPSRASFRADLLGALGLAAASLHASTASNITAASAS